MARLFRNKRRPHRRQSTVRHRPLGLLGRWSYSPDVLAAGLVLLSLAGLLALLRPEGSIAGPLSQGLSLLFGWLAWLAPVWLAGLALLLISRRISPSPWPWGRLVAAAIATGSLLGLAALEARRPEAASGAGGGLLGAALANALTEWFGLPSAWVLVLALLVVSAFGTLGVRPSQAAGWAVGAVKLARRSASAAQNGLQNLRRRIRQRTMHAWGQPGPGPAAGGRGQPLAPASPRPPTPDPLPGPRWKTPPPTLFQTRKGKDRPVTELREQARIIEETLASFNIDVQVVEANQGPVVTQFGIEPAQGVPVSRIMARVNDLALRLGSSPIRIEAPVPGRRIVGIEVPNALVSLVSLREVLESPGFHRPEVHIPLSLGKDIAGVVHVGDLARMPHLLIAGATGSGKSVCINSMTACLLSQFTPDEVQLLMIDPKMVELTAYNGVPHLRMPVVTDMDRVVGALRWAMQEMDRRYKLFAARGARNIDSYNQLVREAVGERRLPYLVVIVDELADLMLLAPEEVERTICRLAQLARATGIHLIVSTQRPSVDVVTGLIKANFPARIAFAVASQADSRVILDMVGAERLLGRGDMLYLPPDASKPVRLQGAYVSEKEIEALTSYWKAFGEPQYDEHELAQVETLAHPTEAVTDDLYERAVALARATSRLSVSYLQRRLGMGYPRAARLMDLLEERGVVVSSEDGRSWKVTSEQ